MIEQADVQALITRTKNGALTWQTLESGDCQADDGVPLRFERETRPVGRLAAHGRHFQHNGELRCRPSSRGLPARRTLHPDPGCPREEATPEQDGGGAEGEVAGNRAPGEARSC